MITRVKICGITRPDDVRLAVEFGASALGFNFYPSSPRYIMPAAARAVIGDLAPFVTAVGVFADETDAQAIFTVARESGVGAVQLHGPRFPSVMGALEGYPIIRAVRVGDGFRAEDLGRLKASAFLLDAFDPSLPGGTGKTFEWALAAGARKHARIIMAGGLTAENVGEAIRKVRPFAVDVASGVESAPGVKDPAKLRAFFAAVEHADRAMAEENR